MDLKLLYKYLSDSCTNSELEEVNAWIDKGLPSIKQYLQEDWQNYNEDFKSSISEPELNELLRRIHKKIRLSKKNQQVRGTKPFLHWYKSAAAILLIPILGLLAYLLLVNSGGDDDSMSGYGMVRVSAPVGLTSSIILPDSTRVYLNCGSELRYPLKFVGATRRIELNGEAYFEVKHKPEKPFVVSCSNLNVTALGTKFNVRAFSDESEISTTLVEGRVVLDKVLEGNESKRISQMLPNQQVDFLKESEKLSVKDVDVKNIIGWKDGLLIFDNVRLDMFAKTLGRRYDVDFVVSAEVKDLTITAKFKGESLSHILESAKKATSINYKIEESNESDARRKVILSK